MAKIFSPPAEIRAPKLSEFYNASKSDLDGYTKAEERFISDVSAYAKKHGKGPLRGESVNFPVADGYAQYVVFTNTSLIHLPVGDAWQFQYANRLTAADIKQNVERDRAMAKLFNEPRKQAGICKL